MRLGTLAIPGAAAKLRSRMIRTQQQQQQQRNNMAFMPAGTVQLVPTATVIQASRGGLMQGVSPMHTGAGAYVMQGAAQGAAGTAQYTMQAVPQGASNTAGTGSYTLQSGGATYTVQPVGGTATYSVQGSPNFAMQGNAAYGVQGGAPYGMQIASSQVPVEARMW